MAGYWVGCLSQCEWHKFFYLFSEIFFIHCCAEYSVWDAQDLVVIEEENEEVVQVDNAVYLMWGDGPVWGIRC